MTTAPVTGANAPETADTTPERDDTPPTDRRHRRTLRTRQAIESAALRLFAEQGFDATTVEQIADDADIAPRTFFRHFPNKAAVLFGDPNRETAQLREVLANRPADEHPMRSIAFAVLEAAERIEDDREQHRMRAQLLTSLEANGDYEFLLLRQRWVHDLTGLVAERLGTSASDPRAGAWAMSLASCFGAAMHSWLVRTDGTSLRDIFHQVLVDTGAGLAAAETATAGTTGSATSASLRPDSTTTSD